MPTNNRIFFASHAAYIGPLGTTLFTSAHAVHGLQSIGITTNFNLEQVFELGQLSIYENIENIPNVEVQMERLVDGYCPMYLLATNGSLASTLVGRSAAKCMLGLGIFGDTQEAASGTPVAGVTISGAYVTQVGYNLPVQGNMTETMGLVCNDKRWSAGSNIPGNVFLNTDTPLSLSSSGGVQRREDILLTPAFGGNVYRSGEYTIWPLNIPGISSSGTLDRNSNGDQLAHPQSFNVNASVNRDEIFELGRKATYFRSVAFPIEVGCEIGIIAVSGDLISATEDGVFSGGSNLQAYRIKLRMREGLTIDLGTQNKLLTSNYTGGDATGGNVQCTYNYQTFNDFDVKHPMDITTALR